jgi:Papain family cysteine protease
MPENLVTEVAVLQPYVDRLKRLGYRTTDQLAGAADVSRDQLAAYLGTTGDSLAKLISEIPKRPKPAGVVETARANRPLGVRLDRIPRTRRAFMMSPAPTAALPTSVNLIAQMQPVRDQDERLTCVAFASTEAAQQYWLSQGQTVVLSPQFMYWDCKQHDGDPTGGGTWIAVAMTQLQADGCCLENVWPYVPNQIAGNESQDPPLTGALADAATHRIPGFRRLAPTSLIDIKSELAQQRCVAFTIPVFDSWYRNAEVTRTGEIVNPIPNEQDVGGHAMCFVGYEDMPSEPESGGGRFYLQNSWDSKWATQSVLGTPGYGTIAYSYIAHYGEEAYSIG